MYAPNQGGTGNLSTGTTLPAPTNKNLLVSQVELSISATTLLDRDVLSKSDPICVVFSKDLRLNTYIEIGRTERISNNLSPIWTKKFILDYKFEERQVFKFAIYDVDSNSKILSDHDYLGSLECSLGEIVAAPNKKFERRLDLPVQYQSKTSCLIIHCEELGSNKEVLTLKANGRKLDKKDFLGKSDPFVTFSKKCADGSWSLVHKSEVIKKSLNPDWAPMSLRVAHLAGGSVDKKIKISVFDWDSETSSELIGEIETTYGALIEKSKEPNPSFELINPKKKEKKKGYTNSGVFNIEWCRVEEERSFLDYIQSGVQLHFTVAIDFTASNGDPAHPQSLHYRSPNADNQYTLAIKAVGEIISDYDSDKLFPALGFGGRVPPSGQVSHEFILNGNPQNPFCSGVSGILEAYFHSLSTVQLFGPTYFAPVINHVTRFASSYQDGKNYFILLIITDGIICDLDATKGAIIEASVLPMSIIIVGVGSEDFSAMEFLDADGKLLSYGGKTAARDIVQFVELRKFYGQPQPAQYQQQQFNYGQNHGSGLNHATSFIHNSNYLSRTELAKCVLAELPEQLVFWMKKLKPN